MSTNVDQRPTIRRAPSRLNASAIHHATLRQLSTLRYHVYIHISYTSSKKARCTRDRNITQLEYMLLD